jgi:hypothetical protein
MELLSALGTLPISWMIEQGGGVGVMVCSVCVVVGGGLGTRGRKRGKLATDEHLTWLLQLHGCG